jgi:hypothetical protein
VPGEVVRERTEARRRLGEGDPEHGHDEDTPVANRPGPSPTARDRPPN